MRVLQINSVCGVGSTGRITTDLYNVLADNGHECCIAYGRGEAPASIDSYKIGNKIDVYYHAIMTRITDKHGLYSSSATRSLIKKITEYGPDIIHLHNIHGYYVNYQILFRFLKSYNKPVIWTLHDCWPFTGHCAYFDYAVCAKWQSGCFDCSQRNSYPESLVSDNSRNNYILKKQLFTSINEMTLVAPSRWLAELINKSFFQGFNVKVINNGIDLAAFKPMDTASCRDKYNIKDKFLILGVASVWTERKGLRYFLKLSELIDSNNATIILVGLNNKQIAELPPNIIGITRTNNVGELAELYSAADVFINPTLEDNFPTTNLEALACDTPVITFNTGGSPECIDEHCGRVLEKGDLHGIVSIIRDMENGDAVFNACRETALKYDKKDRFYEYLKLYERYISN